MPKEIRSPERALEDLYAPNEIVVDQSTAGRLEELCSTMTDTCGLVEATLQLAVEDQSEKRTTYIKTALSLSARGTRAIKMFLSEWGVLVEESKSRANSRPSARSSARVQADLAVTLNSLAPFDHTTKSEPQPLAEMERRAVIDALQEAGGDKKAASRILRIARRTLYRKLKEYNLTS